MKSLVWLSTPLSSLPSNRQGESNEICINQPAAGGAACFSVPARWTPGMTVRVDWESGEASTDDFPGYENWNKYLEWEKKIKASHRQHSKTVPLPDYNGQDVCGITVHFLPCDDAPMAVRRTR